MYYIIASSRLESTCCNITFLTLTGSYLLSTPIGVDYVVIGLDMEVQPLVTHNAA